MNPNHAMNWPRQPDIKPSEESEKEVKISKERKSIVFTTVAIQDDFDLILHKFDLHKALRTSAWILRFINNCSKNKKSGSLTTYGVDALHRPASHPIFSYWVG